MIYAVEAQSPSRAGMLDPVVARYRRPVLFYVLATAIPWVLWLIAGWVSHRPSPHPTLVALLGLLGLVAPVVVAAALVGRDRVLVRDVVRRLVAVRGVPGWVVPAVVLLPPATLVVATAISIPLGYSPEQFGLRGAASFAGGALSPWIVLGLAPVLEELAWHGYGTDALAARWSGLRSSLVFAVIWAVWHLPLGTIAGYYQAEVVETGVLASLNFLLSVFPFVILMNWLYYRSGRAIWVVILFHLVANYTNEALLTHPDTKVVQTAIFVVVAVVVVCCERRLFLTRPARQTG